MRNTLLSEDPVSSNVRTFYTIAKESFHKMETNEKEDKRHKPNGEPSYIITFGPDQRYHEPLRLPLQSAVISFPLRLNRCYCVRTLYLISEIIIFLLRHLWTRFLLMEHSPRYIFSRAIKLSLRQNVLAIGVLSSLPESLLDVCNADVLRQLPG
ncbi:MAG: hypothetical protein HUU08_15210 [Candidatus Brocadia sp.]|nr:hypothetical protein [Candidatus Brocadia sp.]